MSVKESGMSQRIRKFRLESNGTVIFREIRSEIKDYPSGIVLSVLKGTTGIAKFSVSSLIGQRQLREIEL